MILSHKYTKIILTIVHKWRFNNAVSTFAAIDVGSNEISMKIFEIEKKNAIKQLTHVRHIVELGSDTYASGYISNPLIEELLRCT